MRNSSQFLTHKNHLTFPAAVWTSDFAAALCASCANGTTAKSLRDCFAGHCIKKRKEKRNASPATLARLTPRNTSIIYWSETRRRGNAELQIEMWRRKDGVIGSLHEPACSIFCIYFLPKSSELFFSFTLYLSSTRTFSICWSVVVSREAISRPLAWITSEPAAVWHWTKLQVCRSHTHTNTHTCGHAHTPGNSFGCGLPRGTWRYRCQHAQWPSHFDNALVNSRSYMEQQAAKQWRR